MTSIKPLSARELEILQGLAAGESLTKVADRLGISIKTASTHRVRAAEKLNCGSVSNEVLLRTARYYRVIPA